MVAAVMALCLAIVVGLIMNYAPGTKFDDDWSMTLPDASLLSGIDIDGSSSDSSTFEFDGGRDGSTRLVGKYFLPSSQQRQQSGGGREQQLPPAIVMAQGLGLVQDCSLKNFIDAFTAEGMAVFTFDYATFGLSDGLPRHEVDPTTHISDVNAAVEAVRKQFTHVVDVHRIALWGNSLGGGHVLSTSLSPGITKKDIRAVVAQIPFLAQSTVMPTVMPAWGQIIAGFAKALLLSVMNQFQSSSIWWYFPLHGKPGSIAAMQNPGDDEGYARLCAASKSKEMGLWRNAITGLSLPRLLSYRPMNLISQRQNTKEQPPVLLVGAENDTLCLATYVEAAAKQIHGSELFILQDVGHFDIFGGEALEKVLQREVLFLRTHLFADDR